MHCVGTVESTLHVFRDCPLAGQVWIPLLNSSFLKEFYEVDLDSWIHLNLSGNFKAPFGVEWNAIFLVACYLIWKWRNKEVFDDNFQRPNWLSKVVLDRAKIIVRDGSSTNEFVTGRVRKEILVKWISPVMVGLRLTQTDPPKGIREALAVVGLSEMILVIGFMDLGTTLVTALCIWLSFGGLGLSS